MTTRLLSPILLILMVCSSPLRACLWDYDTLRDERRGLPGVAEILAGRWERHSEYFYAYRVREMQKLLASNPNDLAAWDNLAVAQEKLGQFDAAIETILKKDTIKPGEYTTHANLGTFYLHKGDLDQGIQHIRKAIEINANAHFGREKYQLQVAEYLRRAKDAPAALRYSFVAGLIESPNPATQPADESLRDSLSYVRMRGSVEPLEPRKEAMAGIIGMIRFGTGTSPHLYFALGDLLAANGDKHLAYRAYRRAIDYGHPQSEELKKAASAVLETIQDAGDIDTDIRKERTDANAWVTAYQAYERQLIDSGKDAESAAAYASFYSKHGPAEETISSDWLYKNWRLLSLTVIVFSLPLTVILLLRQIKAVRKRRAA